MEANRAFKKFEHIDTGFKYFLGYKDDNSIRPLGIILPQMSGYNKYFDNGWPFWNWLKMIAYW